METRGQEDTPQINESETNTEIKEGYIEDFASGLPVKATPEEKEAVQVFSRILVEDYGYPKSVLQTRPQWRVAVRPSDTRKSYPVDIAVFSGPDHTEENINLVVECKRPNRTDGRKQLEHYLRFSRAELGVWFNGAERLYLRKIEKTGRIEFTEIPNIPRYGQSVDDVGKFRREDLRPATNLRTTFRTIRNYLAANAVGATRDEIFAQQIINIIFCKIYDERFTRKTDIVRFRAGTSESHEQVANRVKKLFGVVKQRYDDVLDASDSINLDDRSLTYVVGELQLYSLQESTRDAVSEAFEVFIGPALKGGQGQFFTPRNVVKMIIDMVQPGSDDKIIDPACGSGGFLVEGLRYVWQQVQKDCEELGWPDEEIAAEKQRVAMSNFFGIDKDSFLSKVAKAYMAILGDGRGGVYCENSLAHVANWSNQARNNVQLGQFDVVITNPPFGKKLSINSRDLLGQYDLGHRWSYIAEEDIYEKGLVQDKQPPQILFIERCLELLKTGGKLGIVLLESIFGMPKYRYIVDYLQRNTRILAIVTLPEDLFQPYTHAKCCVVLCEKRQTADDAAHDIFMAEVKWCGHDSRGNPTIKTNSAGRHELMDDIPFVAPLYHAGPDE